MPAEYFATLPAASLCMNGTYVRIEVASYREKKKTQLNHLLVGAAEIITHDSFGLPGGHRLDRPVRFSKTLQLIIRIIGLSSKKFINLL